MKTAKKERIRAKRIHADLWDRLARRRPDLRDKTSLVETLLASGEAKLVPSDDRYAISKDGDCFSRAGRHRQGRFNNKWIQLNRIAPTKNYLYPRYTIGRGNCVGIHVLVMQTFVGPYPEGSEIRHLDGCYLNPALSNLCYGTKQENHDDAKRHGTAIRGNRCWKTKVSQFDALTIKAMKASGYRNIQIARKFDTDHKFIWGIINKSWKWLDEAP